MIYTRAIRFYPQSYNIRIALRVELYGYSPGKYIECYHIIIEGSYTLKYLCRRINLQELRTSMLSYAMVVE